MASWEDGPEYAPTQRPAAFTAPRVAELPAPAPPSSPAVGAPAERPHDFTQPDRPTPALASLVPAPAASRDATVPFAVAAMTLTQESSAWGAAHSSMLQQPGSVTTSGFDPTRPIITSGHRPAAAAPTPSAPAVTPGEPSAPPATATAFPPPGQAQGAGGPMPAPGYPPPAGRIGVRQVWDALTPGVALGLAFGCVLPVVSLMTYLVAFAFSFRVRHGQPAIRNTFTGGVAVLATVALISLLTTDDFGGWWMSLGVWALVASWVTLPLCAVFVYRSLNGASGGRAPF
ncbi:hypothetical protein [Propionicicella superfundia]|uniref:hypothetical protein n=1 Tax=Propionicicella superfundia TaxID=348582 RepID=UPI000419E712|nr:hypothetical protein [Propionicicella superfundia]